MNDSETDCIFCHLEHRTVFQGEYWLVIEDSFPVNPGHMLLITRRHVASFRELTPEEFFELHGLLQTVVKFLEATHHPDGYNFGANDGATAGQTVFHVHFHVIPRYAGDQENPRGGVRRVKPAMILY